jgi:hypothetical protein
MIEQINEMGFGLKIIQLPTKVKRAAKRSGGPRKVKDV